MKRVKAADGSSKLSLGAAKGESEDLRRKSVVPSTSSGKQRHAGAGESLVKGVVAVSKRKSCPAIGAGESQIGMTSTIAAFLTPERIAKIFGGDANMSEAEMSREIRRVCLCLGSLVKAKSQSQTDFKAVFVQILKIIQTHVDALDEAKWNIVQQVLHYVMTPTNCGTFFSTLQDLINDVLIHRPMYANTLVQLLTTKLVRSNLSPTEMECSPSIAELKCFDCCVKLISKIVEIVGLKRLHRALMTMMSSSYPFVLKPPLTHYYYLRNILALNAISGGSLNYCVLSVVFNKLMQLDCLLSRDILESESLENIVLPKQENVGSNPNSASYIMPFNTPDADELVDEILGSYKKISDEVEQSQQISTLDISLSYLISYLSTVHETINFNTLLSIFESEILPTFNSSCVQFAFFYLINLKEEYLNAFMDFLWKKFLNVSTPLALRILAVGYISGVLARSTKVDRRTLKRWISRLSSFAHEYLSSKSEACHWANVNILAHGPFYAACQAIFYVFAFRHFELIYGNMPFLKVEDDKPEHKPNLQGVLPPSSSSSFMYALNLQRLITSDLNPLKACIPSISKTFVNIAHVYQISYCKTVLDRNSKANIRNIICENMRDGANAGESVNLLNDSFFPFDPLLLPYCKSIVEDCYRPYDGNSLALTQLGESISNASTEALSSSSKLQHDEDNDNCDDFDNMDGDEDSVDSEHILLVTE